MKASVEYRRLENGMNRSFNGESVIMGFFMSWFTVCGISGLELIGFAPRMQGQTSKGPMRQTARLHGRRT